MLSGGIKAGLTIVTDARRKCKMTDNKFPFKVGDKIRRTNWFKSRYVQVLYIGEYSFFGCEHGGTSEGLESSYDYVGVLNWELYVEPKKTKLVALAVVSTSPAHNIWFVSKRLYSSKREAIEAFGCPEDKVIWPAGPMIEVPE